MMLMIRDMHAEDLDTVLEVNRQSTPNVSELDCDEFFRLLDASEYARVVEVDGAPSGYMFVLGRGLVYDGDEYNWFCANLQEDFLYIDQIAIAASCKGKGCGRGLYEDVERYAVQTHRSALTCEVNSKPLNRESMAFHEKLGFEAMTTLEARGLVVSLLIKRNLTADE